MSEKKIKIGNNMWMHKEEYNRIQEFYATREPFIFLCNKQQLEDRNIIKDNGKVELENKIKK